MPLEEISDKKKKASQYKRLRFISSQADTKMSVTNFGNILTSYSKKA